MNVKSMVLVILLVLPLGAFTAETQSNFTIYYQSGNSIYGITELSGEPSLIASEVPQTVAFSHTGRYAAYYDAEGVWISQTETWSPERVISILPREAFALTWTPDDTRLIMRLAFWPEDTDPEEQPLAYNLLTETAEPWVWGQCDRIAQDKRSAEFALICDAYPDTPEQYPERADSIALEWGGEFSEYAPNQYETLLDIARFPPSFDWGVVESGQNLVYMPVNFSFVEIVSLWSDGERTEIGGPQGPGIEFWFSVSPDRSMIAYTVHCPRPLGSCLEITSLSTAENIWHYEDTIRVDAVFYIAWYPDNRKVALLGANYEDFVEWRHILQVFDVETGSSVEFDVGDTTGIIVVN